MIEEEKRDLLLEVSNKLSSPERDEFIYQLTDTLPFFVDDNCQKYQREAVYVQDPEKNLKAFYARDIESGEYRIGLICDNLYIQSVSLNINNQDKKDITYTYEYIYSENNEGKEVKNYSDTPYPKSTFNDICMVVSSVVRLFEEEGWR